MAIEEVEHAIVGAMIGNSDCIAEISGVVSTVDFLDTRAGVLFATISEMWKEGQDIDPVTVLSRSDKDLLMYITESTSVGFWSSAKQYAKDIAEAAKVRRLLRGIDSIDRTESSKGLVSKLLALYNAEAVAGKKDCSMASVIKRFDDCVAENKSRGRIGVDTGFDFLADKIVQYVPGQVWAMGGFTSTGKTAMMVQKISKLFKQNKDVNVCVISTEMTEEQIIARLIGNITGIYSQRIMAGEFFDGEEELYVAAREFVSSLNLSIYEDIFTLSEIETAARKHNMRGGIDVMFIDYVQNCHVEGAKSEYQEQAILAKRVQKLAKDVSATIVCLSQVSNDVGRGNTDNFELKGAGEWAAVADIGIMLQRSKNDDRALKYSIKKNRHGAKCEKVFRYNKNFTRLEETEEYL